MYQPNPIQISTKRGREIPHCWPLRDLTTMQQTGSITYFQREKSEAMLRSKPTKNYNCHGLAYANRRAWIQSDQQFDPSSHQVDPTTQLILDILRDDGYQPISQSEVEIGDIVLYRDGTGGRIFHSGIVVAVDSLLGNPTNDILLIMSKWGPYGEYLHAPFEVPDEYPRYLEYWSERRY